MGKGTDKLYITHSEWSSDQAYSASAGSGLSASNRPDTTFKRLPFNFCAVSLQPFTTPVCTSDGSAIFDIDHILPWLEKNGTNPVTGAKLSVADLIRLKFVKNEQGEYVDPVTFKVLTDNSHVVAIKTSGNVFAWDTVDRLNVKAKSWRDLVSDDEFTRKDIITLQDPHNVEARNLSSFKFIKDGVKTLTPAQERDRAAKVNTAALGNGARVLKGADAGAGLARSEVGKYLAQATGKKEAVKTSGSTSNLPKTQDGGPSNVKSAYRPTALHTTGRAAASLTSTGLTPDTSGALAELSQEDYLLQPKRVNNVGYATLTTTQGSITIELLTEQAPHAVWNFVKLSKKGYYDKVKFHRNIRNFMLQGGDPTGTGRGGSSIWGRTFKDEWARSSLSHDARGIVSMANKGKDTNTSQFFITYRPCKHLDRKHTIFGRVVDGADSTLATIENGKVSEADSRPVEDIVIEKINIVIDPFEEFLQKEAEQEQMERDREEIRRAGGTEDERTTWTGKRLRHDDNNDNDHVGKYMMSNGKDGVAHIEEWEHIAEEPTKKQKVKAGNGGFGNFDGW